MTNKTENNGILGSIIDAIANGIKRAVKFVIDVLLFVPRVIYRGIKSLYIDHCCRKYIDCDDFVEIEEAVPAIGTSSTVQEEEAKDSGEVVLEEAKSFVEESKSQRLTKTAENVTSETNKSQDGQPENVTRDTTPKGSPLAVTPAVVAVTTVEESKSSQESPAEKKEANKENKSQSAPTEKETKKESKSSQESPAEKKEANKENKSQSAPTEKETKNEKPETKAQQDPEPVVEKVEGEVVNEADIPVKESASKNESVNANGNNEVEQVYEFDDRFAYNELNLVNELSNVANCIDHVKQSVKADMLINMCTAARYAVLTMADRAGYVPNPNERISIKGEGNLGSLEYKPFIDRIDFLYNKGIVAKVYADMLKRRVQRYLRACYWDWKPEFDLINQLCNEYFQAYYPFILNHQERWEEAVNNSMFKWYDPSTQGLRNKPLSKEEVKQFKEHVKKSQQSAPAAENVTMNTNTSQQPTPVVENVTINTEGVVAA